MTNNDESNQSQFSKHDLTAIIVNIRFRLELN